MFICFEGPDGCGKTTQIQLLKESLRSAGRRPIVAKHPGTTPFGVEVRKLILNKAVQPESDLSHRLLFWADAVESIDWWNTRRKPGDVLIMDRHPVLSNLAYGVAMLQWQGYQAEIDRFIYTHLGIWALFRDQFDPNGIFVILDVPTEVSAARMKARGEQLTVIEQRGSEYFQYVRQAYMACSSYLDVAMGTMKLDVVDATMSANRLHDVIEKRYLKSLLKEESSCR